MSEDEVVCWLMVEKSPNSFSTVTGATKREGNPSVYILVFTQTKLICVKVGNTHGLVESLLYGPLAWLITKRVQKTRALKIMENTKSLNELLEANRFFEIHYAYVEKLELKKRTLKIEVSWNPEYLDREMRFAILKECKDSNYRTILSKALSPCFEETSENAPSGKRYVWNRLHE